MVTSLKLVCVSRASTFCDKFAFTNPGKAARLLKLGNSDTEIVAGTTVSVFQEKV